MFLIRVPVERLLSIVFGLVAMVTLFQALSIVPAVLASFAMPGRSASLPWLIPLLIRGALLCAILAAGGLLLGAIKARSKANMATWRDVDESLPSQWIWPAIIPTLVVPAVAAVLSEKLFQLWRDILSVLERLGSWSDWTRPDGSGLVLLPVFAALFVPFLEAVAGFFLIAVPPLLMVLLVTRSCQFRMNCQRLVVVQGTFVGASLLGADLVGRVADLLAPHIQGAGGREATLVLEALARGREVLWGTAAGYLGVVGANVVTLWVLLAAHHEKRSDLEVMEEQPPPRPAPEMVEIVRVPDRPATPPEAFQEALARYRARHGRRS